MEKYFIEDKEVTEKEFRDYQFMEMFLFSRCYHHQVEKDGIMIFTINNEVEKEAILRIGVKLD